MDRQARRAEAMRNAEKYKYEIAHLLALDDEFPAVEIFGEQCIGAHIGPGWVGICRPALTALSRLGGKVSQMKQKFGELRIYWIPPADIGAEHPAYSAVRAEIAAASLLSFNTCEDCGVSMPDRKQAPHAGRTHCTSCAANHRGLTGLL